MIIRFRQGKVSCFMSSSYKLLKLFLYLFLSHKFNQCWIKISHFLLFYLLQQKFYFFFFFITISLFSLTFLYLTHILKSFIFHSIMWTCIYIVRYWLLLRESVMSNQIYFVLFCHFQFTCHTRFLASTRMSNWTLKSQSLVSTIIEFSDMK